MKKNNKLRDKIKYALDNVKTNTHLTDSGFILDGRTHRERVIDDLESLVTSEVEDRLEKIIEIVKDKKLIEPNPYGEWVKVSKYNQIMNIIVSEIQQLKRKD